MRVSRPRRARARAWEAQRVRNRAVVHVEHPRDEFRRNERQDEAAGRQRGGRDDAVGVEDYGEER